MSRAHRRLIHMQWGKSSVKRFRTLMRRRIFQAFGLPWWTLGRRN